MTGLTRQTVGALTFLEGEPGQSLLHGYAEAISLIEQCFSVPTRSVLLYADNLPPDFFDVSSRVAGEILQKLRNYRLRCAVVGAPDTATSRRFAELAAAERRDNTFVLVATREDGIDWLASRVAT